MEILDNEKSSFAKRIEEDDLEELIRTYPMKRSPLPDQMAKGLGFSGRSEYEDAVIALLSDDGDALRHVNGRFQRLLDAMANEERD